ncbi:branched-chain amino acid ABC transporter permease [Eoetvoesiella caeni]|uniref:Amino acid/amide ABC transporter membrane protein 1 (HAAT family) n=1 Tax=Eoetvoesiella caeni TaxID=645616 RepID=A0A366H3R7_9BURK|nr:branched-chain amino acid ABC transporter permease [Eoetvoesiella caeni]MCI2810988.1 branched-chain amino acid ABC transporter permease [Eoetvoesiella caeni]NYT56886.1 branched-chain amino acid ABC transporter permease [Eoetvoesiella caeni]RBP35454.1 amino acid/amide ABC transporter membrane protein 1 (HAAT family) [Eoetvoesiella caeni]
MQTVLDAASLGSLYALVALGLGLLMGVLRLINFAHGDFITIGAYSLVLPTTDAVTRMVFVGWNWAAIALVVCAVVVIVAMVSDAVLFKPLRTASVGTLLIASFALSYFIQSGIMMIYGARPKGVDLWPALNQSIVLGDVRISLVQLTTIGVTVLLLVALSVLLKGTPIGLQMRAAATDFKMARLLGVRGNRVIGAAFAISGVLAGVVSLLFIVQTGALSPTLGLPLAIFGFIATVVGGMGSLVGAVVGGFLIGVTMTLFQTFLPPELRDFRDAFTFGLIVLILVFRPNGLFPSNALAERV